MSPILTLGHGTLTADEFAELARAAGIAVVVDVRRFPGSRRHPHFNRGEMERWLPEHGIAYRWLEALGGRRRPEPDSPNVGLRNDQFRAYADHMATPEFQGGVAELLDLADDQVPAVMCAESVWWRCHRRLLADHVELIEERPVEHLFHDGRLQAHPPTPEVRVDGRALVYDRGAQRLPL